MEDKRLAIVNAMDATLRLARQAGTDNMSSDTSFADYEHLQGLYDRALVALENGDDSMTEAKLNRWLGWMQGCTYCMANGDLDLDDFRKANLENEL